MGSVTIPRCDTGSRDEVGSVFERLTRKREPRHIAGIINSGGVLADGMIASQTPGETPAKHRLPHIPHVSFCILQSTQQLYSNDWTSGVQHSVSGLTNHAVEVLLFAWAA